MTLSDYLSETFVRNALLAATLVAMTAGLIGPLVIMRDLAFAVHGTAELAFTGAAAGLVFAGDPLMGALLGSVVVATGIGLLGSAERERNSAIGVILAFGLGVGVYLLSLYKGFATAATNILFGQIFGVSKGQIALLIAIAIGVLIAMAVLYRPLLLPPSIPNSPRPGAYPPVVAADGGLALSLVHPDVKASVFITTISFVFHLLARTIARFRGSAQRAAPP